MHCAASCNDTAICTALVQHGAAIFATTISDGATAIEKCDPYREGYADCATYLAGARRGGAGPPLGERVVGTEPPSWQVLGGGRCRLPLRRERTWGLCQPCGRIAEQGAAGWSPRQVGGLDLPRGRCKQGVRGERIFTFEGEGDTGVYRRLDTCGENGGRGDFALHPLSHLGGGVGRSDYTIYLA